MPTQTLTLEVQEMTETSKIRNHMLGRDEEDMGDLEFEERGMRRLERKKEKRDGKPYLAPLQCKKRGQLAPWDHIHIVIFKRSFFMQEPSKTFFLVKSSNKFPNTKEAIKWYMIKAT